MFVDPTTNVPHVIDGNLRILAIRRMIQIYTSGGVPVDGNQRLLAMRQILTDTHAVSESSFSEFVRSMQYVTVLVLPKRVE